MVDAQSKPLAVPPEIIPPAAGILPKINPYVSAVIGLLVMAADIVVHVVPALYGFGPAVSGAAIPLATLAFGAAGASPVVNLAIGAARDHQDVLRTVETNTNGVLTTRLSDQTAEIVSQVLDALAAKDAPATKESTDPHEPGAF